MHRSADKIANNAQTMTEYATTDIGSSAPPSLKSPGHTSPQTPNFMRPTSSGAARKTKPLKSVKSTPPRLNPTDEAEGLEMSNGFRRTRERKRALEEPESGKNPHGTHSVVSASLPRDLLP